MFRDPITGEKLDIKGALTKGTSGFIFEPLRISCPVAPFVLSGNGAIIRHLEYAAEQTDPAARKRVLQSIRNKI